MTERRKLLAGLAGAAALIAARQAQAFLPWHEEAFPEAAAAVEALKKHAFITGLMDGTLSPDAFLWYLRQNLHYLAGFEKSLLTLSARLPGKDDREQLLLWARETAGTAEWTRSLIKEFSVSEEDGRFSSLRRTAALYIGWEKEASEKLPLSAAWAALLPCFWVYGELGKFVAEHRRPDSRYAPWLAAYGDPAYDATVARATALADRLSQQETGKRREAVDAFLKSVNFEIALWDAAVALE